ncbi:hypothetical protein NECAME_12267 [Necator americanus]|uniref:Uncharacterized protein n=1 Tax=Necator americanus TaxID=51031 RepID=W2T0T3_NECAM|nr:hypothetical protein NECAME_12267 [Necator americanus]ETN75615.1 hypothetical protein NECAME_12267 [Necator americanus]
MQMKKWNHRDIVYPQNKTPSHLKKKPKRHHRRNFGGLLSLKDRRHTLQLPGSAIRSEVLCKIRPLCNRPPSSSSPNYDRSYTRRVSIGNFAEEHPVTLDPQLRSCLMKKKLLPPFVKFKQRYVKLTFTVRI